MPNSNQQEPNRSNYDGSEPLEHFGHELTAQFLVTPKSLREFKSVTALAKHCNVARKTVHCWINRVDVLRRADWLSMQNKMIGKLIIRREWPGIMEKLANKAKSGDVQAIKLCADLDPEDKQKEKSPSLEETLERAEKDFIKHEAQMTPTWLREREERRKAAERKAAENNRPPEEPKDKSNE
jgi:hypothetical protein